jgi:hypothetical protein
MAASRSIECLTALQNVSKFRHSANWNNVKHDRIGKDDNCLALEFMGSVSVDLTSIDCEIKTGVYQNWSNLVRQEASLPIREQ